MGQGRRRSRVQPPKVRKSTTGDLIKTLDPRRTLRQLRVDPLTQVLDANARQNTPPPIDKPTGTTSDYGAHATHTTAPYSTKTKQLQRRKRRAGPGGAVLTPPGRAPGPQLRRRSARTRSVFRSTWYLARDYSPLATLGYHQP